MPVTICIILFTGVRSSVSFEVKRVVEALAAQSAEVSFNVTMTLDVSTQHPLLWKRFAADTAAVLTVRRLLTCTA